MLLFLWHWFPFISKFMWLSFEEYAKRLVQGRINSQPQRYVEPAFDTESWEGDQQASFL